MTNDRTPASPKLTRTRKPRETLEAGMEDRFLRSMRVALFVAFRQSQRRYPVECPKCRQFAVMPGGTGESTGLPDTISRRSGWPEGLLLGVELKRGPSAPVRAAQIERLQEGCSIVTWSDDAGIRYALAMDRLLTALPREALDAFRREVGSIPDLVLRDTPQAFALARKAQANPLRRSAPKARERKPK